MNKFYIIFISLFLSTSFSTNEDCALVYDNASYALSHAKKALKANNFDHQKYYSEKALEAYEKIEKYIQNCECGDLPEKIRDTMDDVENAADPVDWARGRYYSKKVYESTQELITSLDMLSANESNTSSEN